MARTVRAAVQTGPRRIELRSFPRPRTGPDDGLLRIEACGICGSDVEQYKGALGGESLPRSRVTSCWGSSRRSASGRRRAGTCSRAIGWRSRS